MVQLEEPTPVTGLGQGYNTFLASAMPRIVEVTPAPGGAFAESIICKCESEADILNALDVSADLAVKGPWGSFDAKVKFAKKHHFTSKTIVLLVKAMQTTKTTVDTVKFSADPPPQTAKDIYNQGGDSYVSYVSCGAHYLASYTYVATDDESFQQLNAEIDGSFGDISTLSLQSTTNLKNIEDNKKVKTKIHQTAIGWKGDYPGDTDAIVKFALGFGGLKLTDPELIEFHTLPYDSVACCPDVDEMNKRRNLYVNRELPGPHPKPDREYSTYLLSAKTCVDRISKVNDFYGCYGFESLVTRLAKYDYKSRLQADIAELERWRDTVADNPSAPDSDIPKLNLGGAKYFEFPTAEYLLQRGTRVGRAEGKSFADVEEELIPLGVQLRRIMVNGDKNFPISMKIDYDFQSGDDDHVRESKIHGREFAEGGGTPYVTVPHEKWVTSIGAYYFNDPDEACGIRVATTAHPDITHLPPNVEQVVDDQGGGHRDWEISQNTRVVGWAGTAYTDEWGGGGVTSLQPIFVVFEECAWTTFRIIQGRDSRGAQ
ncbi:hypothetical protein HK104_011041 [Borealophlyctis nickersoniae]|nr:hypothetical protein HK104_011041 [Borealophlyctis nickersoniae]